MTQLQSAPVSLVLGGGGGRAIAHIGAWRGLQERGITTRRVVGSSAGALVGACIAAGMSWRELLGKARRFARHATFSLDMRVLFRGIRSPSLFREEPLRELIRGLLPVSRFEQLAVPLSVNAVDLANGTVVWFGEGGRTDLPLADAVYASCALPLLFPPASIGGRHFIDGGVVDPLPIVRARACGGETIVAVDLATADPDCRTGMVDTYCRVFGILRAEQRPSASSDTLDDVVRIHPAVSACNSFDLSRAEELIEAGYRAALARLAGHEPARATVPGPSGLERRGLRSWLPGRLAAPARVASAR
jgi:NTE family protein